MSIDYTTYVGPYAACRTHKIDTTRTVRSCANAACKKYRQEVWDKGVNFCQSCGGKIDNVEIPETRPAADRWAISGLVNERLHPPMGDSWSRRMDNTCVDFWLPNVKIPDINRDDFEPRREIIDLAFEPQEITNEKLAFQQFFRDELAVLQRHYENVEVRWGVVHQIH